jgi:diaminohydroxyphosphoribosylaminopyrimidine deaminase/5-amino-6-(5-phosphoribosylamino)uracil reductase
MALREAGVDRVVFGWEDPGRVSGGGGDALRSAGVEVQGPALPRELGLRENPAFFYNAEQESTYLAVKLAQTLDGRIAEAAGRRTDITGPEARREVQRLRAGFDGILVGSGTVAVDDPLLTIREAVPMRKPPVRIVLDTRSRISPSAKLFQDIADVPLVVFTRNDVSELTIQELEGAGAQVHPVPGGPGGVSLDSVLEVCWETGIRSLLCEGGGCLAASILRQRKAQRLFLFVAPFVLGEGGVAAFPALVGRQLWEGWTPAGPLESFGRDVLMTFDRLD